ncbi:MAG: hypothetical protein JNK88_10535, partial [Mangrovicoccus sp.]|nr:hypothetical protein [Mangrovicoccus sp.]
MTERARRAPGSGADEPHARNAVSPLSRSPGFRQSDRRVCTRIAVPAPGLAEDQGLAGRKCGLAGALLHFATLDADLQNALMTRLVDRIGPEGVRIEIDLSEVELSNFFQEAYNTADTKLVGQVNVSYLTDNTDFSSYELAIGVNDLTSPASDGATQMTRKESSDKYYAA